MYENFDNHTNSAPQIGFIATIFVLGITFLNGFMDL